MNFKRPILFSKVQTQSLCDSLVTHRQHLLFCLCCPSFSLFNFLSLKAFCSLPETLPKTLGFPFFQTDDEDDDFITNEVKRRLKELRRNSFMVLIPEEESCPEDEDEEGDEEPGETNPAEWRDVEAEGRRWWSGFDAVYDKYCERMLFFDRLSLQQLSVAGLQSPSTPSPRSASKKLTSPFRCLSLKKIEEPEEIENLHQPQNDPYGDIETVYVAQVYLTWKALHCQYSQMTHKISCNPDETTSYNHSAQQFQQFQQFQVLLQRFIENEPFEQGLRPEIYARTRKLLPKFLQVPNIKGSDVKQTDEGDLVSLVLAPDLIKIMESPLLTFHLFMKKDKKKSGNIATPLHQVQSSLEKRDMKLKEMRRKRKGWKKQSWPETYEDVQLLFGLIDVKIISRVLRMARLTKEQLFWCEEKMKKLDLAEGKLQRDPLPILFPC